MFSLYVNIVKESKYLDLNYYVVNTQFSNEKESNEYTVGATNTEDLLDSFMKNIDCWDSFNRVVVMTTDEELHNNLMLLTKQRKTTSYTKLLLQHFPSDSARNKYKHCFNKKQLEILELTK